jgi:hypothetical protein
MDTKNALCMATRFQASHSSPSFARLVVGILGSIVQVPTTLMFALWRQMRQTTGTKIVRDYCTETVSKTFEQLPKETFGSFLAHARDTKVCQGSSTFAIISPRAAGADTRTLRNLV